MLTQAIVPLAGIAIDSAYTLEIHQLVDVRRNGFDSYTLNYSFLRPQSHIDKVRIDPDFEKKLLPKIITKRSIEDSMGYFCEFMKQIYPAKLPFTGDRHGPKRDALTRYRERAAKKKRDRNKHKNPFYEPPERRSFRYGRSTPAYNFSIVFDQNYEIFSMRTMTANAVMIEKLNYEQAQKRLDKGTDLRLVDFYNFALSLVNQNLSAEDQSSKISIPHMSDVTTKVITTTMTKHAFRNNIDCIYWEPRDKDTNEIWPGQKIKDLPINQMDDYLIDIHRSVLSSKEHGIGRRKGITPFTATRKSLDALNQSLIGFHLEHGKPGLDPEITNTIARFKNMTSLYKMFLVA
ncbi:MAG TPA: hypothetical protein VGF14_05955 [Alphaproteobacteria bacterium]